MKFHYQKLSKNILEIKVDKRTECFNFGKDNSFPSLIELMSSISVTAKTCIDRVSKAIYGGGFGDKGKVIVNSQNESLNEVYRLACRQYAAHNNVYFQVVFNANLNYSAIRVIPVVKGRAGKDDGNGYSGKYIIYDNWNKKKGKIEPDNFQYVDTFNPSSKVAQSRIEELEGEDFDSKVTNYYGQIIHVKKNTKGFCYGVSDYEPVLGECLSESGAQRFRTKGVEKGFLNTKLMTVQPFKNADDRREFKKELNGVRGAENSSEVILLEASERVDDLDTQSKVEDLSSEYNDTILTYSENQAEKNICKAASVPVILVNPADSGIFGNSGEMLKEAKQQLYESRAEDREQIASQLIMIMSKFEEPVKGLEVLSPFKDDNEKTDQETREDKRKEAQDALKSSEAGVKGLLAIKQSISEDKTTVEEAINIIKSFYGFTEEEATDMIGGINKLKE